MVHLLWKKFSNILSHFFPHYSAISLLNIYSREMKRQAHSDWQTSVYRHFIHDGPKLEKTQPNEE